MSPNASMMQQARPAVYEDGEDFLQTTAPHASHAALQSSSEFGKENTFALQDKASTTPLASADVMQGRVPLGFLQTSEARVMSTPEAKVSFAPASMHAAIDVGPEELQSPIGSAELPQVPTLPFEISNTFIEASGDGHMPPWSPLDMSPATRRPAPNTEPKGFKPAERLGGAIVDDYLPSPIPPAPEPVTPSVVDADEVLRLPCQLPTPSHGESPVPMWFDKDMVPNTASPVRLWAAGEGQGKALEVDESFIGDISSVLFPADASVSRDLGDASVNETSMWSTAGVKKTLSLVDSLRDTNRQVPTSASTTLAPSTSSASRRYVLRVAEHMPLNTYAPTATFSLSGALGLDDEDEEDDLPPRNLFGC